jgi:hypothetical protein
MAAALRKQVELLAELLTREQGQAARSVAR